MTGLHPRPAPVGRSGLIVIVPEAEDVVGEFRARHDTSAALGVPPHLTVLFPFAPPTELDDVVLTTLRTTFAQIPAFDVRLGHTAWFGDKVLWLAPIDPAPFHSLTAAAFAQFPEFVPYEGLHDNVIPHLTVAHDSPPGEMQQIDRAITPLLPIDAHAREVTLLVQDEMTKPWRVSTSFALG